MRRPLEATGVVLAEERVGELQIILLRTLRPAVVEHDVVWCRDFEKLLANEPPARVGDVLLVELGEVEKAAHWHVRVGRALVLVERHLRIDEERDVVVHLDVDDVLDGV